MVFPLIPIILVVGTAASVALQAKDSFSEKPLNTITVSRQSPKQGTDFSNYQIGGISILPIIAIVAILIIFGVLMR